MSRFSSEYSFLIFQFPSFRRQEQTLSQNLLQERWRNAALLLAKMLGCLNLSQNTQFLMLLQTQQSRMQTYMGSEEVILSVSQASRKKMSCSMRQPCLQNKKLPLKNFQACRNSVSKIKYVSFSLLLLLNFVSVSSRFFELIRQSGSMLRQSFKILSQKFHVLGNILIKSSPAILFFIKLVLSFRNIATEAASKSGIPFVNISYSTAPKLQMSVLDPSLHLSLISGALQIGFSSEGKQVFVGREIAQVQSMS